MIYIKLVLFSLFTLIISVSANAETFKDSVLELSLKSPISYKGHEGIYASIVTFLKVAQESTDASTLSIGRIELPLPSDLLNSKEGQEKYKKELSDQLQASGKKEILFEKSQTGKFGKYEYISFPHSYLQEDGKIISSVWMLVKVDNKSSLNIRFFSKKSEFDSNWEDALTSLKTLQIKRLKK